jgi:formate dehydrogenase major subunit
MGFWGLRSSQGAALRKGEKFREATWDEALGLVTRKFSEIKSEHGPDALAFIASSKCTNEEAFLMQNPATSNSRIVS